MAVIHQFLPITTRRERFTWRRAPMPDGSRRTFYGPDAHAVVQKWERAKTKMQTQMQRKAARLYLTI